MKNPLESLKTNLGNLSDCLEASDDDALNQLHTIICDSLVGIFFTIEQLRPNYQLRFTDNVRQEKLVELKNEIALICKECEELSKKNQNLAGIIADIRAVQLDKDTVGQNSPSQKSLF